MLEDMETDYLAPSLKEMLDGMASDIPTLWNTYGSGPLKQSIIDADYYLTVSRSLLSGTQIKSALGQDYQVDLTIKAVSKLATIPFNVFGRLEEDANYQFDFSQFKPRGHYNNSISLQQYFRAMMWLGRVDLRVAGDSNQASTRELGTAMVLLQALKDSGHLSQWQEMDRLLQIMVGRVDSMTFSQLDALLQTTSIKSIAAVTSLGDLAAIQLEIEKGELGFQDILSDLYYSPLSPASVKLPRSFTVMGQRFTMDSWALGNVVFDKIFWDENGIPEVKDKVQRRIPSCLDVAFSVLGNSQIVPEIIARIQNPGRKYRDGLPYQHNLAAVRQVIDSQSESAWSDNIYNGWLGSLRELSKPTTDSRYPQCMRTHAWAMKSLNTQMASWTQLRHDTILYAKPTSTPVISCSYPSGFVEPVPTFWKKMNLLAATMVSILEPITMTNQTLRPDTYGQGQLFAVNAGQTKTNQLLFLKRFAQTMKTLETMATKELAQESFSTNELEFLKNVVEKYKDYFGVITLSGWYPRLYYRDTEGFDINSDALAGRLWLTKNPKDCMKWDAIAADIHTDYPDAYSRDPGIVLHEGVGNVNCMICVIDSGSDLAVYLGPVLSHYEFEQPPDTHLSDDEWKTMLQNLTGPPQPEWTTEYLIP